MKKIKFNIAAVTIFAIVFFVMSPYMVLLAAESNEDLDDYPGNIPYLYISNNVTGTDGVANGGTAGEDTVIGANTVSSAEEILSDGLSLNYMGGSAAVYVGDEVSYIGNTYLTHFFATSEYPDETNCNVYCVDPDRKAPGGGTAYLSQELTNEAIAKCMYYSYGAPGWDSNNVSDETVNTVKAHFNNILPDNMEDATGYYMAAHVLLSYAFSVQAPNYGGEGWDKGMSGYSTMASNLYNAILNADLDDVPENFHVYWLYPQSEDTQRMVTWEYSPDEGSMDSEPKTDEDERPGYAYIVKTSENESVTLGNSNYSFQGIVYGVYTDEGNETSKLKDVKLTLKDEGKSNTVMLEEGTYYLREEEVPDSCGYMLDSTYTRFTVKKGETTIIKVSDTPKYGSIVLTKNSANNKATNNNSEYSLENAVFFLYVDEQCLERAKDAYGKEIELVTVSKTGSDGNKYGYAKCDNIPFGVYYIREENASKGFEKGTFSGAAVERIDLKHQHAEVPYELNMDEPYITGSLKLLKQSEKPDITAANSCYSMINSIYNVYDSNNTLIASFLTDENGVGHVVYNFWNPSDAVANKDISIGDTHVVLSGLPLGRYTVREVSSGEGYALDVNEYSVSISEENAKTTHIVTSAEPVKFGNMKLQLIKQDCSTGNVPQGSAVLTGAQFEVKYYSGYYLDHSSLPDIPAKSWKLETREENGAAVCRLEERFIVGGDSLYLDDEGNAVLPLGTITIEEIKAPEGYNQDGEFTIDKDGTVETVVNGEYIVQIKENQEGEIVLTGGNICIVKDRPVRYDLSFSKSDYGTGKVMADVAFRITSATTGESHIVKTDENGFFSTAAIEHSKDTNANDDVGDLDKLKECGIWFGGTENALPDDSVGALPYDTYIIEELACQANRGYRLLPAFEVEPCKNGETKDLGTLNNIPVPSIQTSAKDAKSESNICFAGEGAKIIDTVSYSFLEAGKSYIVKGTLVDQVTGKPIEIDGERVTGSTCFKTEDEYNTSDMEKCGSVDVEFEFDATTLKGKTVVVFEELYEENEENPTAVHMDLEDLNQTIVFPEIKTSIGMSGNGERTIKADGLITVVDTVSYKNLIPGLEYHINGTLIDKETGDMLLPSINASEVFVPELADGMVCVSFTFDSESLEGKTLVAFEEVYLEDTLIGKHADIEDEEQTIMVSRKIVPLVSAAYREPEHQNEIWTEKDMADMPEEVTVADAPETGDDAYLIIAAVVSLLSLGVGVALLLYIRRKRE